MTGWGVSIIATLIALASLWLYGDRHGKAPIFSLIAYSLWVVYIVIERDWPLALPVALNIAVAFRNLWRMRLT